MIRRLAPECWANRKLAGDHSWIAAFFKALAREDLAPLIVRSYRSDIGRFATWYKGLPIEKLPGSPVALPFRPRNMSQIREGADLATTAPIVIFVHRTCSPHGHFYFDIRTIWHHLLSDPLAAMDIT